jgi:hypothetical protein
MDRPLEKDGRAFHDESEPDHLPAGFTVRLGVDNSPLNVRFLQRLQPNSDHASSWRDPVYENGHTSATYVKYVPFLAARPIILVPAHNRLEVTCHLALPIPAVLNSCASPREFIICLPASSTHEILPEDRMESLSLSLEKRPRRIQISPIAQSRLAAHDRVLFTAAADPATTS